MLENRKIRAIKNIVSSLGGQVIVLLCGIIIPRLMIDAYGSESYGALSSITQFLAYITLLECGIGGVARAALYKPLAIRDMTTISIIMREIKRFFRILSCFFVVYVVVLACSFKTISRIGCMDWLATFILVVVISISIFGQYFVGISYEILLQADQKKYVVNVVSIIGIVINTICTIALIHHDCSLIVVKLVTSSLFLMRPIFLWLYVEKHYKLSNNCLVTEQTYITQKWAGFGQHISYFLHSNTDIAVLTVFADLRTVAVYSLYNMIVSHIQNFAVSFSSGMEAVFGDMLARNENQQLHNSFRVYESTLSVVAIILFSTTAVLIVPFIKLYTQGITDADYMRPWFAFIMVLTALSYCLRLPYHAMVIAAGHFKQTSVAAYGEAIINIVLSIILVSKYGLVGATVATFIATWYRFIYYVIYLSKNIFYREKSIFLKRFIINIVTLICNCTVGYWIVACFNITNYLVWVECGLILVIAMFVFTLVINLIWFRNDYQKVFLKLTK